MRVLGIIRVKQKAFIYFRFIQAFLIITHFTSVHLKLTQLLRRARACLSVGVWVDRSVCEWMAWTERLTFKPMGWMGLD